MYAVDNTTHTDDTENYWTRLNYGLVAIRERRVCVVDGYWSHVVHIAIPELPAANATTGAKTSGTCSGFANACRDYLLQPSYW